MNHNHSNGSNDVNVNIDKNGKNGSHDKNDEEDQKTTLIYKRKVRPITISKKVTSKRLKRKRDELSDNELSKEKDQAGSNEVEEASNLNDEETINTDSITNGTNGQQITGRPTTKNSARKKVKINKIIKQDGGVENEDSNLSKMNLLNGNNHSVSKRNYNKRTTPVSKNALYSGRQGRNNIFLENSLIYRYFL